MVQADSILGDPFGALPEFTWYHLSILIDDLFDDPRSIFL